MKWLIPDSLKKAEAFTLYEGWIAGYTYYDGEKIEKHLFPGGSVWKRVKVRIEKRI